MPRVPRSGHADARGARRHGPWYSERVQVDAAFLPLLSPFDLGELDRRGDTAFAVSGSLRLAYHNAAWDRFARENGAPWSPGAWGIGASIVEAIPEVLRPFYDQLFARARNEGAPVDHDYECSTPEAIRKLRMRVYPLPREGWLVVSSFVSEQPTPPVHPASAAIYRTEHGLIVMCAHCRRVRRTDASAGETWDWVPGWVARPPAETSHGLCSPCVDHHYPRRGAG